MTLPDFSAFVRSESALFAAALADVDPAARVPACPDWTAADLLWHLGEVQWFWSAVVAGRPAGPTPTPSRRVRTGTPSCCSSSTPPAGR